MGKAPDDIRQEIEETRARMGDTIEAIGHKTDVKGRASEWVSEKKDRVVGTVSGAKDRVTGTVSEKTPDTGEVKERAKRGVGMAKQNPLGLAIGGAAVGFLTGLLVPSTEMEDERIGEVADRVKERVKETGQEALDRGKEVAREAGQTAMETARERGKEQGQELSQTVKEGAQDVAGTAREQAQRGGTESAGTMGVIETDDALVDDIVVEVDDDTMGTGGRGSSTKR